MRIPNRSSELFARAQYPMVRGFAEKTQENSRNRAFHDLAANGKFCLRFTSSGKAVIFPRAGGTMYPSRKISQYLQVPLLWWDLLPNR